MQIRIVAIPTLIVLAMALLVRWAASGAVQPHPAPPVASLPMDLDQPVRQIDELLASRWQQEFAWQDDSGQQLTGPLEPAAPAEPLTILRRLSLALHGTVPSLEEIRAFEADEAPQRLRRWTERMLNDKRFADYFAERLARSLVGVEGGQFIIYRRDRFTEWLSGQLQQRTPYDDIVRSIVADIGLWTDTPSTNFITAAYASEDLDENELAGRTTRAFLGQRIDCAQCHDHPFAPSILQADFEGLAAFYGQTQLSIVGVEDRTSRDGQPVEYTVEDRITLETRTVAPVVPFHEEWLPAEGSRREQLAAWVTHPENRRFERAIANRVWGLIMGRPFFDPVDDLPDPDDEPGVLDLLGADFRAHNCDLRRLIQVITATRAFRADSIHPEENAERFDHIRDQWAVFPLTRLRPEQVIGSMLQAASIKTIDRNSNLFIRAIRFFREQDFVEEFGDPGENELDERAGTVPQALLRMNGKLARELTEANPVNAVGRISGMAATDEACLEACFLVCLTRLPTEAEREHFLPQLAEAKNNQRTKVVEDLFWALFNSPEFSWNH